MRKVLSIVLVLALVLGSVSMAFAAPMSDVAGGKYEDAVNVLTELGVVNGYPDGTYKPANIVTRGEMAKIVICALGLEDYAAGSSSFKDMAGHWSDKYVAYAVSLGIINGYPDGTFKPDNTVTYDEAAKMLVAALGYTEDALIGSWPANWIVKARALGILDGVVAGSAGANRGDIALMAFQTLSNQLGYVNKDGEWVKNDPNETMLDRLGAKRKLDAKGNDIPFVLSLNDADEAVANVKEFLGAYVTAYFNSDDEIIAIKEVKSVFLDGELTAAGKFEADDVEYTIEAGAISLAAAFQYRDYLDAVKAADGFVNGGSGAVKDNADVGDSFVIAAKVSGKKIQAIYSTSTWSIIKHDQFEDGELDDESIMGRPFKLDDNDEIDLKSFALIGVSSLEDIEEDDVVYIYEGVDSNGDTTITKIAVGTEVIEGEVTRIRSSKYTVGGTAYEVADQTSGFTVGSVLGVGNEVKLHLDAYGDIYHAKKITGEADKYGVVLRLVSASGLNTLAGVDAEIELFLTDGTVKKFKVDDSVFEDLPGDIATGQTNGQAMTWAAGVVKGSVVKYDLNSDGDINDMALVVDSTTAVTIAGPTELTAKSTFNGYKVLDDAVVFTYALDSSSNFTTDKDDYGASSVKDMLESKLDNVWYVLKDNQINFMYVDKQSTTSTEIYAAITATEENNSVAGWGVDLLIDGKAVEKDATKNFASYAKDAIYVVSYDMNGAVSGLKNIATTPDYDKIAVVSSTTITVSGKVVSATMSINGAAAAVKSITLDDSVAVYKWDTDKYKIGNISDIKSTSATNATFYDVDDDLIYDIVLLGKAAPTTAEYATIIANQADVDAAKVLVEAADPIASIDITTGGGTVGVAADEEAGLKAALDALAGMPALGVTITVNFDSGTTFDVTITKGAASVTTTIDVTAFS